MAGRALQHRLEIDRIDHIYLSGRLLVLRVHLLLRSVLLRREVLVLLVGLVVCGDIAGSSPSAERTAGDTVADTVEDTVEDTAGRAASFPEQRSWGRQRSREWEEPSLRGWQEWGRSSRC